MTAPPFEGVVLCGGRSRRMGRDKALLPVGGVVMARRVADALAEAGAERVTAQGGDLAGLRAAGLVAVADEHPGDGPFPATIQALQRAVVPLVVVVACDLVSPTPDAFRRVLTDLVAHPQAQAAVPLHDGHHQWTHAAWRVSAAPLLAAARARGIGSLRRGAAGLVLVDVVGMPGSWTADADGPEQLPADR